MSLFTHIPTMEIREMSLLLLAISQQLFPIATLCTVKFPHRVTKQQVQQYFLPLKRISQVDYRVTQEGKNWQVHVFPIHGVITVLPLVDQNESIVPKQDATRVTYFVTSHDHPWERYEIYSEEDLNGNVSLIHKQYACLVPIMNQVGYELFLQMEF